MSSILDIFEHLTDVSLWALDETGKHLESNNFYSWSPVGKPKILEHNGTHKGLNIIGATEIFKAYTFLYEAYEKGNKEDPHSMTHKEVISFLDKLIAYDKQRGIRQTFVILDNARFHKSSEIKAYAREHKGNLFLLFQPKYSPQLNPQENMWKWMKNFMATSLAYKTVDELSKKLEEFASLTANEVEQVKQRVWARNYYK